MHTKIVNTLIMVLVSILMLSACDKAEQDQMTEAVLRPVKTTKVALLGSGNWREFPGVVDAKQIADLSFRVSGKLKSLLVNEGDRVKLGETLAQLDQTDYKIQYNSRLAEYNQANGDFKRAKELVDKGHISRTDFDKLKAQSISAKANLDAAKQSLDYASLIAPFNGHIAKRYVNNHEDVSAMQHIYSLQDSSALIVKINVPETIMINLKKGVEHTVSALFDAIPDKRFPLTFKEVSTQVDEQSKTFEVTFTMQAVEGHNILPGMSTTVRGKRIADQKTDGISIYLPSQSVMEDQEGRFVYIVADIESQIGVVQRRNVTTGALANQGIEINSGLESGDEVVTAGMSKMREGLKVKLMSGADH